MLTTTQYRIEGRNVYKRPTPGFKALRGEDEIGSLTRVYTTGVAFSIPIHKDLSVTEIKRMERKLDRMHDFHLGQTMAFTLKAKHILKETDTYNPGHAIASLRAALVEMHADLEQYASLQQLDQFTLDDEMLFDAETRRYSPKYAHG